MRYLSTALKLAISAVLAYFLISKIDFGSVGAQLSSWAGVSALAATVVISSAQAAVGAGRLIVVLRLFGIVYRFGAGLVVWLIGAFFGQAFISFIGGDAARVWRLVRTGVSLRTAAGAVLYDRAIGLVALTVLFVAGMPLMLSVVTDPITRWGVMILAAAGLAGSVVFFAAAPMLRLLPHRVSQNRIVGILVELGSVGRVTAASPRDAALAAIFSFLIHVLNIFGVFFVARVYGLDVSFLWCAIIMPPVLLLTMLPISLAGWGVRESAMVVGFGFLGFPAHAVLAVSVTVGAGTLIASLVGAPLFMVERKRSTVREANAGT